MRTKIVIILFSILFIQFITSCCRDVKHFDFTEMSVKVSSTIIETNKELKIELAALDLEFLAYFIPNTSFQSAFATSCDDGWGGMKYPLQAIEITSSNDFNSSFPAQENLLPLFQTSQLVTVGELELTSFTEVNLSDLYGAEIDFVTTERPTIAQTHQFQIKLTKKNDEIIVVKTPEITWQ